MNQQFWNINSRNCISFCHTYTSIDNISANDSFPRLMAKPNQSRHWKSCIRLLDYLSIQGQICELFPE